ncbi:choice-of-anchor J domain-containing protein [uncultured Flavobacterium sp.]|uniref:T9SS-dependent choice-of-anchor J family protein n=1 Tax=uncultured Flavobacterium sp. TaxID=165435 RepID=UPI0030EC10AC
MNKTTFYIFMFMLFSFASYAQFEDFEGTSVPTGGNWILNSGTWKVFDNGIGLAQSWSVIPSPSSCNGRSAYLSKETVANGTFAEDWLVTPQVLIPNNGQLRFSTKQTLAANFGSIYTIRVSTVSQTDVASFTTIQTWDETDLNAVYNVCEEKIVSLSAFAGLQVYVAFVMTNNNGDRWIIDDVDFAEQCLDPINLTATNNTTTSADLSWTNPSSATQWEVEIIPAGTNPSGTGTITNTIPYTVTGLTSNTCYDYYVRSLCTSIYKSEWVGPYNFCTLNIGSSCAEPFPVSNLPFQSTGNTAYHSDLIDGIPGSSGCGTTGTYLDGNDVFYSFTATSSNSLIISSQTNSTWSGLFIYNSCSNVGVSCVAGNTGGNGTTTPDRIIFTPTAGQTYYIVISSLAQPQTVDYTLTIQEGSCINMYVDFEKVSNCNNIPDTFFIEANIYNMGTAISIVGTSTPASPTVVPSITSPGTMQFGPFTNGTNVNVHLQNQQDANCFIYSNTMSQLSCDFEDMVFKAFLDLNNDTVKQNNEPYFTNGTFQLEKNNSGSPIFRNAYSGITNLNEVYSVELVDASFIIDSEYSSYLSSLSIYDDLIISTNPSNNEYFFPISVNQPFLDESLYIGGSSPRPGFTYYNTIVFKNNGTITSSGVISFTKDPDVAITSVSNTSAIINSSGFTLNYTNLLPQETRYLSVEMYVPNIPVVNLGDIITNSATITSTATDVNSFNNSFNINQVIIGAYDPNDKMEAHGETININSFTTDDYLFYTIRFQNTGTADAINVEIQDALNSQLNPTTLRMIDASHNYILTKDNNQLTWKFADINLPSNSVSEELSQGYVSFKIKPNPGFAVNDMIPNTAEIYFDFNPAIITNTFQTTFVNPLSTENFLSNEISIYPNPTNDILNINYGTSTIDIKSIQIHDMLGKVVYQSQSKVERIDLSNFNSGIYIIAISTENNGKITKKLIKN